MAFVDTITITAKAGDGGDGVVRWLHEKGKEFGGPSGGDGGTGGNVVFRALRDLAILARYRGANVFKAGRGSDGASKEMSGKGGDNVIIDVPVGALITHLETGETFELLTEGETRVALSGGRGGAGNARFKSSVNQYPTEATRGVPGESGTFTIELKIIADVGLVGLPNAGKSSLLNALTRASAKVGAYAFTTLEPNLGVFHTYILADIPGLIEGASSGKGLGHQFLRHISRTRILLHCISAEEEEPSRLYEIVRKELALHDEALIKKLEIIFLTKADAVTADTLAAREHELSAFAPVIPFSVIDDVLLKEGSDKLIAFLRQKI